MVTRVAEKTSQSPQQPRKAEYLSKARSKMLRELCISIIQLLEKLLHDPNAKKQPEYLFTALHANYERLRSEGIVANMHVGEPRDNFEDPITAAEFIAGQLINLFERGKCFLTADVRQELSAALDNSSLPGIVIKGQGRLSPAELDFTVSAGVLSSLTLMLDATDSVNIKQTQ